MSEEKLDIFLSSDQQEFTRIRGDLSRMLCTIPFLKCLPLENRGADSSDVLESSLRGVRHSDVYIGIFGLKYSSITVEEFHEAVKYYKPCFIYVKKIGGKDNRLETFIEDDVKSRFKYHQFRTNSELVEQVQNDLKKFIFETLRFGIASRSGKKAKTQALLIKEESSASEANTSVQNLIDRAETAFRNKKYLESIVVSIVALETTLKDALHAKGAIVENQSIGTLLRSAAKMNLIDGIDGKSLQEISYIRNKAVHMGELPKENNAYLILNKTKQIVKMLAR